ncbi:mate-domain-containing protein [Gongronella butleri]|nr:mate-domain-containing protein [Gongronella butleri]
MTISSYYTLEFQWLLKNASPLIVSYLLQNSLQSVSVISAGHLGASELAAASLSSMFVTVTGLSMVLGTTLCLDTLCSQSYTSHRSQAVGLHVQRCLVLLAVLCVPVMLLWWHTEPVFLLLKQDPTVARLSGIYCRWMILALPAFALFEALKKMLQAQGLFRAPTYTLFVGAPFNLVASFTLVRYFGFVGSPMAAALTYWVLVLLLVFYILKVDGSKVWPRWQWRANALRQPLLADASEVGYVLDKDAYWTLIKLAVPGMLLICSESWAYEIIALAASWIDTPGEHVNQGAQSVLVTTTTMLYTLPFGLGIASANRVGNSLGNELPKRASRAALAALVSACAVALANVLTLTLCRHVWGYLFTDDAEVVAAVSRILPLVAVFVMFDNVAGVADGILNGQGRQHVGAWCNLAAYYLTALPLGMLLCFYYDFGLNGIWLALTLSIFMACVITVYVVLRTDWAKEARLAAKRAGGSN